jgi:hypothetical protein
MCIELYSKPPEQEVLLRMSPRKAPDVNPVPKGGRGRKLEALLIHTHQIYWDREHVIVEHNQLPGRWLGKGRFVPAPQSKSVDFHGVDRGRPLVFDAKECRKPRWRLDTRYAHQFDRLCRFALARAIAWFAVEDVRHSILWLLRIWPQSEWPVIDFAEAPNADMLKIARNEDGWYDWLPAVRSAWFV